MFTPEFNILKWIHGESFTTSRVRYLALKGLTIPKFAMHSVYKIPSVTRDQAVLNPPGVTPVMLESHWRSTPVCNYRSTVNELSQMNTKGQGSKTRLQRCFECDLEEVR